LLTLNSLVTGAGGLLFWFLATRRYPPSLIGIATAGTSMVIFLSGLSLLGLNVGIVRYCAAMGANRSRRLQIIFLGTSLVALATGCVFWWLMPLFAAGLRPLLTSTLDIILFVGSCVTWTVSVLYDHYLISRRFNDLLVVKSSIIVFSRILLIALIPHLSPGMIVGLTGIGGIVGVLGSMALCLLRPADTVDLSLVPVSLRGLIGYSLWNYISLLAMQGPTLIMPTIIVSMIGGAQAAAYYIAWTVFNIVLLIPGALSWALLAEGSAAQPVGGEGATHDHRKSSLIMIVITVIFLPLALGILVVLGHTYVVHGWLVLIILAAGVWPYHRANLLLTEMRLIGSQKLLASAYAASQVVVVILTFPLLSILSTAGAALSWTFGQGLLFLWLRLGVRAARGETLWSGHMSR